MEDKVKLPALAINVWKIHGVIEVIIFGLALIILFVTSMNWNWSLWIFTILIVFYIIYSPVRIKLFPNLRWKHFFYEIKEDEIDIQDGIFVIKRTLVPVVKIQKVYITQGPILKKFDLANVTVYTAASEETIPALPYKSAEDLRNYISQLVKVSVDDG